MRQGGKSLSVRQKYVQQKGFRDDNVQQLDKNYISNFFAPVDEQQLHNGRVVRELSHRVLSRSIAQSNVLIVSPDLGQVHVFDPDSTHDFEPGLYPAKVAIEQGHSTHLIPSNISFGHGWINDSGPIYNSTTVS